MSVVLGYPNGFKGPDEPDRIVSEDREAAVRLISDAILGYFAQGGPYTFNVFSAREVGVDGTLNADELARHIARAIGERAS